MSLRIAFCGPNTALNIKLTREVETMLRGEVAEFALVESPLEEVLERTGREKFHGADLDWMCLWASSLRRMTLDRMHDTQLVLSASCGIDEVAIQATFVGEQMNNFGEGLVLAGAGGEVVLSEHEAMVNRSGAVLQVILNSAEEEVVDFWDFVYAVMPVSAGISKTPNPVLAQYNDFLTEAPAFQDVRRLPDNEEAALDALRHEVTLWKQKLAS